MIYVMHALLAVTAFLVVLNGFLRGAKKAQIDVFLSVILLGLLVACFILFGWKAGVATVVLAFVYAIIARPLAARVAAQLLGSTGGRKGEYIGLPPVALARISKALGPSENRTPIEEVLSGRDKDAEEALLAYCEANEQVKEVMHEFGANRETLLALYRRLQLAGAGQWAVGHYVPASAIAYPHTLRYLLRTPLETKDQLTRAAAAMVMHFERGDPVG